MEMMKTMRTMMKMFGCAVALSLAACAVDAEDLTVEERAEIAGATMLSTDEAEAVPENGPSNKQLCGGFAGLECPGGMMCVDFPGDGCNPNQGGADCIGMCVGNPNACDFNSDPTKDYIGTSAEECASIKFFCDPGEEYFSDECGCGCLDPDGNNGQAETCGDSVCGAGLVCCNASCGICTEPGGFCTQLACL